MYYRDYSVKKYAKGGMINLSKYYKTLPNKDLLVGLKVYDKINEEYVYIKDVDSGIRAGKNKNDEFGHNYSMSDLMIEEMAHGGMMAKGDNLKYQNDYARFLKKLKDSGGHILRNEGTQIGGNIMIYFRPYGSYPYDSYTIVFSSKDGSLYQGKKEFDMIMEDKKVIDENGEPLAKGGNVEDEFMGFNVMINTKKDYNKFKKLYVSDADEMGDNTLFFSFDNEKNANKKIKEIENHLKQLNIEDYFIQNVYSSEFN